MTNQIEVTQSNPNPTSYDKFKALAIEAKPVFERSKEDNKEKQAFTRKLAWYALQASVKGDGKSELAIVKMVSKEGGFQILRQAPAKGFSVAKHIREHGNVTFKNKEGFMTFTDTQCSESNEPLFSVATVYSYLKKIAEKTEEQAPREVDFLSIYAQANGLTVKEIETSLGHNIPQYIEEGKALYADMQKELMAEELPARLTSLQNQIDDLASLSPDEVAQILSATLAKMNMAEKPFNPAMSEVA